MAYSRRDPQGRRYGPDHPPPDIPADAHWLTEAEYEHGVRLETEGHYTFVIPGPRLELAGPAERTLWITHRGTPDGGPLMPDASGFRVRVVGIMEERTPQTEFTWTARLTYRTLEFEPQTHIVEFTATGRGERAPADLFRRAPGRVVDAGDHSVHTDADRLTVAAGGQLVIRVATTFAYAGRQHPLAQELGGYQMLAGDNPPFAALRPVLRQTFAAVAQQTPVLPTGVKPEAQTLTLSPEEDAGWLTSILCVETESHDAVRQFRMKTADLRTVSGYTRKTREHVTGPLQLVMKGHPVMNNTGDGGAGLGQITNPAAGPAELWDWRANARAAVAVYCDKAALASRYVRDVRRAVGGDPDESPHDVVRAVNEHRRALGQPPLTRLDVPAFTPRQMRDDMARGYMGFQNPRDHPGQFGLGWHEYRLATEGGETARLRVEHVRQEGGTWVGDAVWTQVDESERPGHWERGGWVPRFGKANYVRAMHTPPCGTP